LRTGGTFGLIASNTLRQGATREGSLAVMLRDEGSISRAINRLKWPGEAGVVVCIVHFVKAAAPSATLNGRMIPRISAYLVAGSYDETPSRLAANEEIASIGSFLRGSGFIFDDEKTEDGDTLPLTLMRDLIAGSEKKR
jgi:hypothetical protein